ncbi:hypothetical protein VTK26DRAFT_3617 [Humicola hyalothermophila]
MPPRKGKWPSVGTNGRRGRSSPAIRSKFRDPAPTTSPLGTPSHGFSMRDEARNTASHQSSLSWITGDAKLRQKPVIFVSAGFIEPLKDLQPRASPEPDEVEGRGDDNAAAADGNDGVVDVIGNVEEAVEVAEVDTAIKSVEQTVLFTEQKSIIIEQSNLVTQESTVTEKEELSTEQASQPANVQATDADTLFYFDLDGDDSLHGSIPPPPQIPSPRSSFGGSDSSEEIILFRGRSANTRTLGQKDGGDRLSPPPALASLALRSKASTQTSNRPTSQGAVRPATLTRKQSNSQRRSPRPETASEEQDDEDAILADYIANMVEDSDDFISQSLAKYRDLGGDDDAFNLGSGDDVHLPQADEFLDLMDRETAQSEGSINNNSDSGKDDLVDEDGDQDMDMDADMDDKTLARLLARQDELGIGGDEFILSSSSANVGRKRGKHSGKAPRVSASASQVADAFDDLDLADWDQDFGQTRKRKSKQPPNFNVSDSEIEEALRNAWQRDRMRKKNRKMEREALRAHGLLDKNADPDDLRVKYREGMKLDDIKTELTSFLLGSGERLEFPPLDKHARKVLHELASKFNIKSQSTGKGDQRRPVLYRTNRTVRYASTHVEDAANHVNQASMRIHRKYFHRVDVRVKRSGSPRPVVGGRSSHKALTLREGEIVGASVPELGQENKGRAMLEKMGWSKGMALGSIENQGILEPLAQVVKRSKAGLG